MTLPTYLQNLPSRNLAQIAISNVGQGNPPYLSIANNRFTLVDVAGNTIPIQTLYVDCIIVDINPHMSQTYFDPNIPYDPNNPGPPLCFSDNGIGPSTMAREPQSVACNGCPKQTWEKINALGNKVPWCQKSQKIAIWPFEHSDGLFLLKIPPASAFDSWRGYMAKFENAGLDPEKVITRITFIGTGVIAFQSPGYIDERHIEPVLKMRESKAYEPIVGRLDKPRTAALPAPPHPMAGGNPESGRLVSGPGEGYTQPPLQVANPFPGSASVAPPMPAAGPVAATQTPAAAQQPVQRRRRTKAEMEVARAQAPAAPPQPQQAPFRPDPPPAPASGQAQQAQFGIVQNPPAPPPGLDLDAVFK